jgi:putative ABC transport system permease protein
MKTPLAWLNLADQKKRTAVAVAGVGFAVLLVFMQLGFYGAAAGTATTVYDELDFDILLLSAHYIDINRSGTFPLERLYQAKGVEGVAQVIPLYVSFGAWRNPDQPDEAIAGVPQKIMVIGLEPEDQVFRRGSKGVQEQLERHRTELQLPGRALIDSRSHKEYWPIDPGQIVEVGNQRVHVVDQFTLGTGFGANGLMLVSRTTFVPTVRAFAPGQVSLGLIRLRSSTRDDEAEGVAARLGQTMPDDVKVRTRAQVREQEQNFWLHRTSIGLIFFFGVAVALIVGLVFVYQVIASDISNRLHEYATLKSMGYGSGYLALVVLQQAVLLAVFGCLPGLLVALVLYAVAHRSTGIPITMDIQRAVTVFLLTVVMCSLSGVLALRKVRSADPADLF